jgi:nucleoside-diphosphate-sugar epimerase
MRRTISAASLASYPAITQNAFVELLGKIANRKVSLVHVSREQIERHGGSLFAPPYYFGAYLDIPPITVRTDRARSELGLGFTPLEEGFRQTYRWYRSQQRPEPDFSWEDRLLASAH